MKTREQVLQAAKAEQIARTLDGRNFARLSDYFPVSDWHALGFKLVEGQEAPPVKEWTRENIIEQMRADVDFGFEKALNKRGISSSFMYETVKMWLWVLEDDLEQMEDYAQYGLPLFKATAVKYGFPNPIGDDTGDEWQYASD